MKKNKKRSIICAGVCAMALAGMSLTSYADTETTGTAEERMMGQPEDDGSVTAKIVSADSSSITVYLSEQPEHNGEATQQDGDATPPEKPADADDTAQLPEITDGTMPERPEGDGQQGGHGMMMNFSEETTTLTLTDDTVITKGMEQESASVSDLTADTIVRIVTDGDTVVSISVMDMEMPAAAEAE